MYSNLVSQLKEQNALDKLEEVLREVPNVRREMGYPPLVTPTSQLVGTQATLNVLVGKRWHIVPNELKCTFWVIMAGLRHQLIGNSQESSWRREPITTRPGEILGLV